MAVEHLSDSEVLRRLVDLDDAWTGDAAAIVRTVEFSSFLVAVEFISRLAPVAEELNHHPDLRLSWRTVEITLSTHSAGGVTDADFVLANRLDELIAALPRH